MRKGNHYIDPNDRIFYPTKNIEDKNNITSSDGDHEQKDQSLNKKRLIKLRKQQIQFQNPNKTKTKK